MSDASSTMKGMMSDALTAARGRVEQLTAQVAKIEGDLKPVKEALKEAKVEVERIERASKVYDGNRMKRGRKPKPAQQVEPPVAPKAQVKAPGGPVGGKP